MRRCPHIILKICLLACFMTGAAAQELDLLLQAQLMTLDDPVIVETKRGQDFAGQVESNSDGTLILAAEVGGGEVIYSFKIDEILRVRFPGNELKEIALESAEVGEYATALIIIDRLFAQRVPLFTLLGEAEISYFAQTVPIYRQAEQLRQAYDRIAALRPYLKDPGVVRLLEREQLLLAQQLGLDAEMESLAQAWIASEGREVRSALGSCLLALALIDAGRAEEAFQTVLYPITFSRGRSIEYLDNCYSIALELARFLDQATSISALSEAIEQRGIASTLEWNDFSPPDYSRLSLVRPNL